jgi:hypothetical protein
MKSGIFYEHQLPRPWNDGAKHGPFQEALDQVELADQPGIDYAVEHHFLEEYSHSSAPEIFLAACSWHPPDAPMARKKPMQPIRDEEIPVYVALGRKVAEEGPGTERQKQNAKLWADAAKVTLGDSDRHGSKTPAAS